MIYKNNNKIYIININIVLIAIYIIIWIYDVLIVPTVCKTIKELYYLYFNKN